MQEPFIDLKFFIKLSLIGPSMSDLGPFKLFLGSNFQTFNRVCLFSRLFKSSFIGSTRLSKTHCSSQSDLVASSGPAQPQPQMGFLLKLGCKQGTASSHIQAAR